MQQSQISIAAVAVSYFLSRLALRKAIDQTDKMIFLVAISLFIAFSYQNIEGKIMSDKKRKERLNEPHMRKLSHFVEQLRQTYPEGYVPDFDPNDGGVEASILFLLEKPGPKTDPSNGGSGFISQDNNDPTARATKRFLKEAEIDRKSIVIWNTISVWNGTRAITKEERRNSAEGLQELLKITKNIKSIVLVGRKAQKMERELDLSNYKIVRSFHPSPINRATAREGWERIPEDWAKAK